MILDIYFKVINGIFKTKMNEGPGVFFLSLPSREIPLSISLLQAENFLRIFSLLKSAFSATGWKNLPWLCTLTRLSCVLSGGATGRVVLEAVDGDGLVYDEESADYLPFVRPEQSYTVQDKQHNMRPEQYIISNTSVHGSLCIHLFMQPAYFK